MLLGLLVNPLASELSGLRSSSYTLLNQEFSSCFGITEGEAIKAISKYKKDDPKISADEIKRFYINRNFLHYITADYALLIQSYMAAKVNVDISAGGGI